MQTQSGLEVYLDMDPGVDDAVALAVAAVRFRLQGVSTVAGNVSLDRTTANAGRLLHRMGLYGAVPLRAGAAAPLFHPLIAAPSVHGESGLDGFPEEFAPQDPVPNETAWSFWGRCWRQASKPLQVVATGPLTNLARAGMGGLLPAEAIAQLVWMGGSLSGGNVTPYAEFNAYVDPVAADWVLTASGWPMRIVGLDVTRKARFGTAAIRRLERLGPVGEALAAVLEAYCRRLGRPWAVLHDVVAVAALDAPWLFRWQRRAMTVVHDGRERGAVLALPAAVGRVWWATDLDLPKFYAWFWALMDQWRRSGNARA